jgi:CHASE3 domain sensor protein
MYLLVTFLKDQEVGDRIKVAELRQLVRDDPSYQNLTTEEENKMKQDTLELRELRKVGARPTNKSAAQDYRAQLTQMNNEARY